MVRRLVNCIAKAHVVSFGVHVVSLGCNKASATGAKFLQ